VEGIGGLGSSKNSVLFIMKAFLLLIKNKSYNRLYLININVFGIVFLLFYFKNINTVVRDSFVIIK